MFVDKVQLNLSAGNGGDGAVSFRHEKFIDRGGPDGGDGGDGGSIIFVAHQDQNTLAKYRYKKEIRAEDGQAGSKQKRHGKTAKDLELVVPVGTLITDQDGEVIADLTIDQQSALVAKGGEGGFGNAHFVSSRRQAPKIAEKGEKGQQLNVILELKLIADIGIIGLPNAGKSTLLSKISNARPQIANYPFTTLTPNLGVVDIDKQTTLLFADVPGLIAGASQGKGLGDEFLRHVERTGVLLHMIDVYEDITEAYTTIRHELASYKVDLTKRPQVVALNKTEGLDAKILRSKLSELKKLVPKQTKILAISAAKGEGLRDLLFTVKAVAAKAKPKAKTAKPSLPVLRLADDQDAWKVEKTDNGFVVSGKKIERFASRTDFSNPEGQIRLKDIIRKMGIEHELVRKQISRGDKIYFGQTSPDHIVY